MTVTIRAFASAKALLGGNTITLDMPDGARVADVWDRLCEGRPKLAELRLRGLALNREYVDWDAPVHDGDELATGRSPVCQCRPAWATCRSPQPGGSPRSVRDR
ncbi:MAG: MoaD/ThiS family protein [Armatimonadetes bacterium]|nr:MoaD/ThiS family protein [Armatimonadota bacterium]